MLSYDKIKKRHDDGGFWTSYSDLATVLSILFLLLYVVATLRSTAVTVLERQNVKEVERQLEAVKEQLRAYEVLKQDYLSNADAAEKKMYEELLSQMQLLEVDAGKQKQKLVAQANEAAEKEDELNRYQKMIKNIIQSNMIAQKEIKTRDKVIEQKTKNINELKSEISEKEQNIIRNQSRIAKIQKNLELAKETLIQTKRDSIKAKQELKKELTRLERESAKEVEELRKQNEQTEIELTQSRSAIAVKSKELAKTQTQIDRLTSEKVKAEAELADQRQVFEKSVTNINEQHEQRLREEKARFDQSIEKEKLTAQARLEKERAYQKKIEEEKAKYANEMRELESSHADQLRAQGKQFKQAMSQLKSEYESGLAAQRAAFEEGIRKEKLTGAERLGREQAYAAKLAAEKDAYNAKMKGLSDQLGRTQKEIEEQGDSYRKSLAKANSENQGMARELSALREREAERQELARRIQENFKQAGIKASVDAKSGEVLIHFGEEYFETGRATLKPGMQKILQNAIPAYAKSILSDTKLAERIANVEIVGFASPTYKGNYVNPKDLSPMARQAVDYNMDLSYQRAKSIFDYVFDPKKFKYDHQQDLLPLAKVTGQGYLKAQGANGKEMTGEEYCAKYDCTKAQKVVIKFHFKE